MFSLSKSDILKKVREKRVNVRRVGGGKILFPRTEVFEIRRMILKIQSPEIVYGRD